MKEHIIFKPEMMFHGSTIFKSMAKDMGLKNISLFPQKVIKTKYYIRSRINTANHLKSL
jgi:hypothetical protein